MERFCMKYSVFTLVAVVLSISLAAQEPPDVTLKLIMSHPDWIGNAPERSYWADDGKSVYYWQKQPGNEQRDLLQINLKGEPIRTVAPEYLGTVDVASGSLSSNEKMKVYARKGDIYVKDLNRDLIHQITRTVATESSPAYTPDNRKIIFKRGGVTYVRELASGLEYQPVNLQTKDDPDEEDEEKDEKYLDKQQERLFEIVQLKKERKELAEEFSEQEQSADPSRSPLPWYLGKDTVIDSSLLSPNEKWMAVITHSKKAEKDGKKGSMPNYVTATGYVESKDVRARVGTNDFAAREIHILNLETREQHTVSLDDLPGITDDPLESLKAADDKEEGAEEDEPSPRDLGISFPQWNDTGSQFLFQAYSRDNKDRWIVRVSPDELKPEVIHHQHDAAWINWSFRNAGWMPDDTSVYFLSEANGYSQLFVTDEAGAPRALTPNSYEVSSPTPTKDGAHIFFRANLSHPGIYEVYRVTVKTGKVESITELGGRNSFALSPDESQLLITHTDATHPAELYVQKAGGRAKPARLTHTISDTFSSVAWTHPEFVTIPSSHVNRPIYSRVYTPTFEKPEKRPAVVFVHGAGYLQNAHQGWSSYFREFMFHSLLARQGYVVLDMDYRASAGYGRDWRTAIYRQMGTPELEDIEDGVNWLVANENVDPERVGVYGGSYGGFLTLMGLFTKPDLFACGAALRPVTDWAHYNHGYTSNILNTPEIDPVAFEKSSPIEFAEGLTKPLIMLHGMQDNNVFFQDSVRLAQKLIELEKENWELAVYPIEAHGFREPSSWLDEYRRIYKLFETHLK
jgi:dipeptidyl aminopeptidase/acylaminoacyl peptidase